MNIKYPEMTRLIQFIERKTVLVNIAFCLCVVLIVFFKLQKESGGLTKVYGKIEMVQNRIVKHNRETLFRIENQNNEFVKLKTIDNPSTFNWFKWLDIKKGDSVSFYIHESAVRTKAINVIGLHVNGEMKESATESIINDFYRNYYIWMVPVFLLNLACFFLIILPSLSRDKKGQLTGKINRNFQAVLLLIAIVSVLWVVPWLLSVYQPLLEQFSFYRVILIYWKVFLFLLLVIANFVFKRVNTIF